MRQLFVLRRLINAAHFHPKRDVFGNCHRRVEGVGLKHHCDVAVFGADVGHVFATDAQLTACDRLQPSDTIEQRGLTTAGRADQNKEVTLFDRDIDVFQDFNGPIAFEQVVDF